MLKVPYKTQPDFELIPVGNEETGIVEIKRLYGLTPAEKLLIKELAGDELETRQELIASCQKQVEKHNDRLKKKIARLKITEENLRSAITKYYQAEKNPKKKGIDGTPPEQLDPELMQNNRIELEEVLIELEQNQSKFVELGEFFRAAVSQIPYDLLNKMPNALSSLMDIGQKMEESGLIREKAYLLAMFQYRLGNSQATIEDVETFQKENPLLASKIVEFATVEQGGKESWDEFNSGDSDKEDKGLTDEDFKSNLVSKAA